MLDSGVRIAAAFLPVGIPVLVGLVVAVVRRRALPAVSGPAIVGLLLQLLVVLASTFLVAAASFNGFGLAPGSFLSLTSVLGFGVIVLQVLSWTLLLVALFRRLPARSADRTPTGRHALLDEQGEQVIAEEGTTLLPVGAAAAGAGAGVGLGAAAAGSAATEEPVRPGEPWPEEEPAVTETFAVGPAPDGPDAEDRDADAPDLDREEPPAVTAESLDEAAETEDEAQGDVADTPDTSDTLGTLDTSDDAVDPDDEPVTATVAATDDAADDPAADPVQDLAGDDPADDPADDEATPAETTTLAADDVPIADPDLETGPDDGDAGPVPDEPEVDAVLVDADPDADADADAEDDAAVTDTLPATETATTTGTATTTATPSSGPTPTPPGGHPWFDPDGAAAEGTSQGATSQEASRAGSTEGR